MMKIPSKLFFLLFFAIAARSFSGDRPYLATDRALELWANSYLESSIRQTQLTVKTLNARKPAFVTCEQVDKSLDSILSLNLDSNILKSHIGNILSIRSPKRLKSHLNKIYKKLDTSRKTDQLKTLTERVKLSKPSMVSELTWVHESEMSTFDPLKDAGLIKGSCYRRLHHLQGMVNAQKLTLSEAKQAAEKVARCYGSPQRDKFYLMLKPTFAKIFGDSTAHWFFFKDAERDYSAEKHQTSIEKLKSMFKVHGLAKSMKAEVNFLLAKNYKSLGALENTVMHLRSFALLHEAVDGELFRAYKDLVLISFELGRYEDVLEIALKAKELFVEQQDSFNIDMFSFWRARSFYLLDNEAKAVQILQQLAHRKFSGYYGALSQSILKNNFNQNKAVMSKVKSKFYSGWVEDSFAEADKPRLAAIDDLIRSRQQSLARCEIEELGSLSPDSKALSPRVKAAIALLHYVNEDLLSAIKSFSSISRHDRLTKLPVGLERILFPRRFSKAVEEFSKKLEVDSDFVLAIMRQESVFNPKALSRAGAVGLLQLMPSTARLEMRRVKDPKIKKKIHSNLNTTRRIKRADLMKPLVNIGIGIHHISSLFKEFNDSVFVMTSYNAGPTATERWIESIPTADMLTFIEWIPYKETRLYVKLVLRNYFYYKVFYRDDEQLQPELINSLVKTAFNQSAKSSSEKSVKESW